MATENGETTIAERIEHLLDREGALQRMETWDGLRRLTFAEIREGAPTPRQIDAVRQQRDEARALLEQALATETSKES